MEMECVVHLRERASGPLGLTVYNSRSSSWPLSTSITAKESRTLGARCLVVSGRVAARVLVQPNLNQLWVMILRRE